MNLSFPTPAPPPLELEPAIALPQPPGEPSPFTFPLVATIAPVIGSVAIWAITQSAFALVFAFLGPIIAVGSLTDSSLQGRRRRRREQRRFEGEVGTSIEAIRKGHARERARRATAFPGVRTIIAGASSDPRRWGGVATGERHTLVPLPIGRGDVPSALELTSAATPSADAAIIARIETVRAAARRLADATLVVDAAQGIGICGRPAAATAAARACVLQLARFASPAVWVFRVDTDGEDWRWLDALPHRAFSPAGATRCDESAAASRSTSSPVPFERVTTIEFGTR